MSEIIIDVLSELIVSEPEYRLIDQAKSSNEHGFYVIILVANSFSFFFFLYFLIWNNLFLVVNNYLLKLKKTNSF